MTISSALVIDTEDLDTETIQRIRNAVAEILAEADDFDPDPSAVLGWTMAAAAELRLRLERINRPVQARTIAAAAHNGGFVARTMVYDLGGYDQARSLNGFTKPVRRVMRAMVSDRLIPAEAAIPMEPVYDPSNPSFQRTQGFRMPAELAAVFAQAFPAPRQ